MIRITQVKLHITHTAEELNNQAARQLKIQPSQIRGLQIIKQSIDARKRSEISFSYVLDIQTDNEKQVLSRSRNKNAAISTEKPYQFPKPGMEPLTAPPVIIGFGPAGLFCGLMLARHGYRPLILERGGDVEERTRAVEAFWKDGILDPNCNVQFGEGGAGTFSDGKLNTLVKDPIGRNREVLRLFAEFGADPAICYQNKPHIGTDVLSGIVTSMRQEIIRLGGQVRFHSQVTELLTGGGQVNGLVINGTETIPTGTVVLAVGHSARDTFSMLLEKQVPMEAKPFAVGLRIQHPQELIDNSQYGKEAAGILGPASYKLTHTCDNGRGVYTFCMCPGGKVVNASSEEGRLAVNGMSYHARDGKNANSALIVTVTPEDYPEQGPLAGVAFQRALEEKAFTCGGGKIPVQLYGDFKNNSMSAGFGEVTPEFCGQYTFANLRELLPSVIGDSLETGIEAFGQKIPGFNRADAILAGVESRTSSPVRILRDEDFESQLSGLYPCGEGAGYAGGITSAAMDGLRIAEAIARKFALPLLSNGASIDETEKQV